MPITGIDAWRSEHEKLANTAPPPTGVINLSRYINTQVTGHLDFDPSVVNFSGATFTWQWSIFASILMSLTAPATNAIVPITFTANAWGTATQASIMFVPPGSGFKPKQSTNGVAALPIALIDPTSIASGVAGIIRDLLAAPKAPIQKNSKFPEAIRAAFAQLTITVTGSDTTSPVPVPFAFPLTPVK